MQLIFTGFIQVDPQVFGLIPICTGLDINNMAIVAIHYSNPLLLAVVIAVITYVSGRWPRYAIFHKTSSGVNAICILLYILFNSLTHSSLSTLVPLKYPGVKNIHVALDPDLQYFHTAHLPYALAALAIQAFPVYPFLFILTLSPCLIRFSALNLTRIKPILDEFQACYHDKCRCFAGYYLLCRQIIFVIFLLNLGIFSFIYILQVFSILILVLHCIIQPYKSTRLNILDSLLLLDLVLLSLLHGNTANIVFEDFLIVKMILTHTLILLPIVYFLCLCGIYFIAFMHPKMKRKIFKDASSPVLISPLVIPTEEGYANASGVINGQHEDEQQLEREPLLFMQSGVSSCKVNTAPTDHVQAAHPPGRSVLSLPHTGANGGIEGSANLKEYESKK